MSKAISLSARNVGLALSFGAIALLASFAVADDPPAGGPMSESAALAVEIRQLVEELQTIRSERSAVANRHREAVARVDRQIETLQDQLGPAEESIADQRAQLSDLQTSLARDKETIRASHAWAERIATAAVPIAESAARRSAPHSPDSLAGTSGAFAHVSRRLAEKSHDRAASVAELCRLFGEQWLPARSVSFSSEQVKLDAGKRAVHAWVYRVGLASAAFASEDGKIVGVSSGDAAQWSVDLPDSAKDQIRQLIDVAREQKPPAILRVPVRASHASAGSN
jgi:hypothetical protein